jgi:hypothetical protein
MGNGETRRKGGAAKLTDEILVSGGGQIPQQNGAIRPL